MMFKTGIVNKRMTVPIRHESRSGRHRGRFGATVAIFLSGVICAVAKPADPEKPLERCKDHFDQPELLKRSASKPKTINVELAFDARTGSLFIDNGTKPISVDRCFVDRFISTRQVVTLKVYSKFRTDVTVTPTTYTVQEEGLALSMPTQPSGSIGQVVTALDGGRSRQVKSIYCNLDPTACDLQTFVDLVQNLHKKIEPVAKNFEDAKCEPKGHECYRNQAQFEQFVSATQAFGSRWTAAMQAITPGTTIDLTDYNLLLDALMDLHKISGLLDRLRQESEQTNVSALNQPSSNQLVQLQFLVQENWVPLTFTPLPSFTDNTAKKDAAKKDEGKKDEGKTDEAKTVEAKKDESQPKQQSSPANVVSTTAQPHIVRTILLEIHHEVRFNAVGGFYWSTLHQNSFSVNPGPVYCTSGTGPTATTVV
jgi:hypothetical protein